MSPRRRLLVVGVLLACLVALAAAAVSVVRATNGDGGSTGPESTRIPAQDVPGPVLLVPGYGGGTAGLESFVGALVSSGRQATIVPLPGDGTGPLEQQADVLDTFVERALDDGASSVDVIGYSAGGVVARVWAERHDGAEKARRIVTLGSPHHGAQIAALGALLGADTCPAACQELVPQSPFLSSLQTPVPTPPQWLALWTTQDQTVVPPDSGSLEGAVSTSVQSVCPSLHVGHGDLPTDPVVIRFVLDALGTGPLVAPSPSSC